MSSDEIIHRRKKARRSCLKCQKSHKTCGNERPCRQCIKRGIPLSCVDGSRKLPKYLCDASIKAITGQLYPTTPYHQTIQLQQHLDIDIANRDKYYTHYEPTGKEDVHENRRHSLKSDPVEFVDPQMLHNSFPYTELSSPWKLGAPLEERYDAADFTKTPQNPPLATYDGQKEPDITNSSSVGMFRDNWDVSPTMAVTSTSKFVSGGDSSGDINYSNTNFGFAIKSGWSSTFFI